MKQQRYRIRLLAMLLILCFLGLIVWGAWSVTHYGNRWFSHAGNVRLNALKKEVTEGDILDRNGILLARTDGNGVRVFRDSAADRASLVHILGDRQRQIANTVESLQAGYLYGYQSSLPDAIYRLLRRTQRLGNNVTLTVDADLCTESAAAFARHAETGNRSGAAVVMNYRTGEILALISLPSFDPDNAAEDIIGSLDQPYWNRALQAQVPPGSTFKIITAAAMLGRDSGSLTESFSCTGSLPVSDAFTVHDFSGASHGNLTLSQAFMRSCNVFFASQALKLGSAAMQTAAESFGFNRNFLFRDLVVSNSVYPRGTQTPESLAASGYGQSAVTLSPLHLCLITAAAANDGIMMEPRLVRSVRSASGAGVLSWSPVRLLTACEAPVARMLQQLMKDAVQGGGSGSAAAVTTMDIRGKTGTSESTDHGEKINYGWFTGYNAQADLPIAVTVLVEDIPDGETGGTTAALVVKDIFTYIRNHPDRVQ